MTNLASLAREKDANATPMETCPVSIQRPETPTVLRAAGIRLPHDQSAMTINELQELLDIDMQSSTDTYIDDVSDLLSETKGVFPNTKLPFLPSIKLLKRLRLYDGTNKKWKFPKTSGSKQSERYISDLLNNICSDIAQIEGVNQIRRWNSNYCNTALEGSPISRKPDIILVDFQREDTMTWTSVRAVAEVTVQDKEPKRISNTVTDKSYIILTTQPNRVFVPILSFWGVDKHFCARLTVTDRQGQLRSQILRLGAQFRESDYLNFLRLLIGLCFAPKDVVGYDPTMETDVHDNVVSIFCGDKWFKVIRSVFESQSLVGRATRVWEVEYEKKKFILKDTWIEKSRVTKEYELLATLQEIKGVPTFLCGDDVSYKGQSITTGVIRNGIWGDQDRVRIRRRIITSSIGDHIASFSSKKELISVLRDIVISM